MPGWGAINATKSFLMKMQNLRINPIMVGFNNREMWEHQTNSKYQESCDEIQAAINSIAEIGIFTWGLVFISLKHCTKNNVSVKFQ